MKIVIASDHAGYELKNKIINELDGLGHEVIDLGANSPEAVDYPDFAKKLCKEITLKNFKIGILVCGSGIGMSIVANRNKDIRAALCHSKEAAKVARSHNDANVLCLGSRTMNDYDISNIIKTFIDTKFEGGRHLVRIKKINC